MAPSVAFLSGLAIMAVTGIINTKEALIGFSNETLLTIGSLFVIARAAEESLNIKAFTNKIFGKSKNIRLSLLRIMLPVSLGSAFINNTPVVATLINPIIAWSRKNRMPSSKFLIPLSHAAIFGGTLTLIGTSTNLVVSGLLTDYGLPAFSFFELTRFSLPLAIAGIGTIIMLGPKLIPERELADIDASEIEKKFAIDMLPGKKILNKSITQAGLRKIKDIYVVEIIRQSGEIVTPVRPVTRILEGDTLRFTGNAASLAELDLRSDLRSVADKHADRLPQKSTYIEAVVGHNISLVNKNLEEIDFRGTYQAAVLAIFRAGVKLKGSLRYIRLKPGDTLLLITDEFFEDRWNGKNDFLFMRQIGMSKDGRSGKKRILFSIALILILLIAGTPLSIAMLGGALSTVFLRLMTISKARDAIDFDLLIMIAAALGVASGVDSSGLATTISNNVIGLFDTLGPVGLLFGIVLATTLLTELITNAAAALLVFPIAMATAAQSGSDPRMFAIAIALAASLAFISPFGYQTSTMVYSAGAYKFSDFMRLGVILDVITIIGLTTILSLSFGLF